MMSSAVSLRQPDGRDPYPRRVLRGGRRGLHLPRDGHPLRRPRQHIRRRADFGRRQRHGPRRRGRCVRRGHRLLRHRTRAAGPGKCFTRAAPVTADRQQFFTDEMSTLQDRAARAVPEFAVRTLGRFIIPPAGQLRVGLRIRDVPEPGGLGASPPDQVALPAVGAEAGDRLARHAPHRRLCGQDDRVRARNGSDGAERQSDFECGRLSGT